MENKNTQPNSFEVHPLTLHFHRKKQCSKSKSFVYFFQVELKLNYIFFHTDCPIETFNNKYLKGFDEKSLETLTNLECISQCLIAQGCLSAERNKHSKVCFLQEETRKAEPELFLNDPQSIYWDISCIH